jgi:hypothetical protein
MPASPGSPLSPPTRSQFFEQEASNAATPAPVGRISRQWLSFFQGLVGGSSGGSGGLGGFTVITPASGNATIDLGLGLTQLLVLSASAVTILAPIFTGGTIVAGANFLLFIEQDATGGRATPTFTGGAGAFASDTGTDSVAPDASTRTIYWFSYDGSIWAANTFRTGRAIS